MGYQAKDSFCFNSVCLFDTYYWSATSPDDYFNQAVSGVIGLATGFNPNAGTHLVDELWKEDLITHRKFGFTFNKIGTNSALDIGQWRQ